MKKRVITMGFALILTMSMASAAFAETDPPAAGPDEYTCYYFQAMPTDADQPPLLIQICTVEKLNHDQLMEMADKELTRYAAKRKTGIDPDIPIEAGEITDPETVETMIKQMTAPMRVSEVDVLLESIDELKEIIEELEQQNSELVFENAHLKRSLESVPES